MSLSACTLFVPKSNREPILWAACCVGREVRAGPVERANYASCAVCVIPGASAIAARARNTHRIFFFQF
jgi:hypothetical protein